ncbi:RNaseH domain-containing protein [Streptomyces carpaticus]|uniref:RNaseH domain-containing protein n=1 Tax=Streptomyces carpaticus TaxID=285558 RepID=UPI0031F78F3C
MTERLKRPRIPFSGVQFPLFAAKRDGWWPCELHGAAFPAGLLPRLERAWACNPKARRKDRLPTWALTELLLELEPQLLAVSTDLRAGSWLRAVQPLADTTVVALALEAWVCGYVAPHQSDIPWGEVIAEALELQWKPTQPNLLEHGVRPNGTAEPSEAAYKMLATFLAASWVDQGRRLGGRDTDQGSSWIMGPASSSGDRSVFLWPPTRLTRSGEQGYGTHYLRFNVVTLPHDQRLLLRVVPHVARMAATQPAYIPRRSQYEPATATLLLYAPNGVLRGTERDTLLRAPVTVTGVKDEMRWTWKPGLPQILSRLPSPDLFPLPDQVRKDPARFASPSEAGDDQAPKPRVFLQHSTGYNYFKNDEDGDGGARETGGHPTGTGFQPIDHLTVFESLAPVLEEHHILPVAPAAEVKPTSRRLPKKRTKQGVEYPIELWHATPRTADAVHLVLTQILGLKHITSDDGDGLVSCYRGEEFSVRLRLAKPGLLLSGWPRATDSDPDKRRRARQAALETRAQLWQDAFPPQERPVGCLIELEGPGYYKAARLEDPKQPLKNALPSRCNRLVQVIKPVNRDPNPDAKSTALHPFEDTAVRRQDIERISAALLDLLRQLGRLPALPPLFGTAPLEVSALWLAHAGPHFVPMLLRMRTNGTATGQLVPSQNHPVEPEIPLERFPAALAEGRGKVKRTDQETLARFLRGALAEDDTHDRLFIARAATLRNKGIWPWLSNQHITADALVWPGISLTDPEAVPVPRTPASLPGLRIVRINDDNDELPHGFGIGPAPEAAEPVADVKDASDRQDRTESDLGAAHGQGAVGSGVSGAAGGDTAESVAVLPELPYGWGRFSGVARWNDRGYLAINPRPATTQLPKGVSKVSGPGNDSKNGQNPTSLHIHASFLQDGDDPDQLALYVQTLRRFHAHTDKATRLPMILHLGKLMEEYIP